MIQQAKSELKAARAKLASIKTLLARPSNEQARAGLERMKREAEAEVYTLEAFIDDLQNGF